MKTSCEPRLHPEVEELKACQSLCKKLTRRAGMLSSSPCCHQKSLHDTQRRVCRDVGQPKPFTRSDETAAAWPGLVEIELSSRDTVMQWMRQDP